jgi:RimJ/RimL family protein N-acetyltransferase
MINFKSLETQNYILEKFKLSDVNKKYFNWLKDKKNNKFLTNFKFNNISELKSYVANHFMKDDSFFLKILTKKREHIGNLRIHNLDKKKNSAFLGIIIGETVYKNKGVAQEVIHYICKFLFAQFKISKVFLGINQKNKSATTAYLKSGFVFVKKTKNIMVIDYFVTKLCIGTAQFGSQDRKSVV